MNWLNNFTRRAPGRSLVRFHTNAAVRGSGHQGINPELKEMPYEHA